MRIFIDASTHDEIRVGVVNKRQELAEYFFEDACAEQVKGSIFLGIVTRVEPSLQAAFVDYGAERNGFLSFREVHPDYFRIPVADRPEPEKNSEDSSDFELFFDGEMESTSLESSEDMAAKPRFQEQYKRYKMQEVIKPNQVILVQIVKEERQQKGAALTSFITLSGRYSVLLPNSPKSGGISRRIRDIQTREKLQKDLDSLDVQEGSSLVVRTACEGQGKSDLKVDYNYLRKTWRDICEKTIQANAPSLIHKEFNVGIRSLRDFWSPQLEEVWISGKELFDEACAFVKVYAPRQVSKIKLYTESVPIFEKYCVENQIQSLFEPTVYLPSGGYIVINQTEALVSIDVNSGRATKERHIEETALQTNLSAVLEVARQIRLRDLSGLLVVDFIDMMDMANRSRVEQAMQLAMAEDRARVQISRISQFGLMEMSRQRLGFSAMDKMTLVCTHCRGAGVIKRDDFLAKQLLRALERVVLYKSGEEFLTVYAPQAVYLKILSSYTDFLGRIRARKCPVYFGVLPNDGKGMRVCDENNNILWCENEALEQSEKNDKYKVSADSDILAMRRSRIKSSKHEAEERPKPQSSDIAPQKFEKTVSQTGASDDQKDSEKNPHTNTDQKRAEPKKTDSVDPPKKTRKKIIQKVEKTEKSAAQKNAEPQKVAHAKEKTEKKVDKSQDMKTVKPDKARVSRTKAKIENQKTPKKEEKDPAKQDVTEKKKKTAKKKALETRNKSDAKTKEKTPSNRDKNV